ncbi:MAG: hypothetical protein MJZ25_14255 [Fibrobacter sp.]|nr:hypothetical protein [Fibrobacter sp.]
MKNTFVYFHCRTAVNCALRKSKSLKNSYDWSGMPVEFRMETRSGNVLENTRSCSRGDSLMPAMAYDGTGRRVSKTRERKACPQGRGLYA